MYHNNTKYVSRIIMLHIDVFRSDGFSLVIFMSKRVF